MATIKLTPSAYTRSNTQYVTVSNPNNMYYDTSHTANYASIRGRNSSNTSRVYYCFIHGFDFTQVPSNATVNSFTIKIRCYKNSYQRTGETYRPRLASSPSTSSVISNTTLSSDLTTSATTYTFPTGSLTWNTLKNYGTNFSIAIPLNPSSNQYPYIYVYGAEILVDYTTSTIHATGVDVSPATTSLEEGETATLTATVTPSNATDKSVSWTSSNTSVVTVNSSGVVTAVSAGSATITATTTDGGYTDTCAVTVTAPVFTQYRRATSMEPGKSYLIANGNSGSVYMLTNEANGSRTLRGVAATVNNDVISIPASVASRCLFECVRYTAGNDVTITVKKNNQYLYCDNSNGLRMNAPATLDRFWHYREGKFWQFKSTTSDGYSDASSEYKYYLNWANGNATDSHVDTTSIEASNIPLIYIFTEYTPSDDTLYIKPGAEWVEVIEAYEKVSSYSWALKTDVTNVFDPTKNYVKGD